MEIAARVQRDRAVAGTEHAAAFGRDHRRRRTPKHRLVRPRAGKVGLALDRLCTAGSECDGGLHQADCIMRGQRGLACHEQRCERTCILRAFRRAYRCKQRQRRKGQQTAFRQ